MTFSAVGQDSSIVDFCDQPPVYQDGEKGLIQFIHENITYPAAAIDSQIEGVVHVQFVVYKDGGIGEVRVVKGLTKAINDEAIRVVEMMPKWKAGEQDGKKVNARYTMPIRFFLKRVKKEEMSEEQRGEWKDPKMMLTHLK